MKIITLLTSFLLGVGGHMHAQCFDYMNGVDPSNFYMNVFGGANFIPTTTDDDVEVDYKTGFIVSGSYGYRLCYGFRMEAEYAFRRNAVKQIDSLSSGGHFQSSSYMGNLLWDLPLPWTDLLLFVGGGLGYDCQQIHADNGGIGFHDSKKGLSWQGMAGLSYPMCRNLAISLEYKYHRGGFSSLNNNSIGLGFTYTFERCR